MAFPFELEGVAMPRTLRQNTTPGHGNRALRIETTPRHCTRTLPQVIAPRHCARTLHQDMPGDYVFLLARKFQHDAVPAAELRRDCLRTLLEGSAPGDSIKELCQDIAWGYVPGCCVEALCRWTALTHCARTVRQDAMVHQSIARESGHHSKSAPRRSSATVRRPQYTTRLHSARPLGPWARTLWNAENDF